MAWINGEDQSVIRFQARQIFANLRIADVANLDSRIAFVRRTKYREVLDFPTFVATSKAKLYMWGLIDDFFVQAQIGFLDAGCGEKKLPGTQ